MESLVVLDIWRMNATVSDLHALKEGFFFLLHDLSARRGFKPARKHIASSHSNIKIDLELEKEKIRKVKEKGKEPTKNG